jgi:hypothetical protein
VNEERDTAAVGAEPLFPRTRERFADAALRDLIDEAERAVPSMRAASKYRLEKGVNPLLPIQPAGQTLVLRCAVFAVAITERGVQLSEGIAREVEADALFPAAAIARSQLELIGLSSLVRQRVEELASDVDALAEFTLRMLFASRSLPGAAHFAISDLVNAAKRQLGEHFGDDYGLLSELAHPNAMIIWAAHHIADSVSPPTIDEDRAMLLVKVAGQGLTALGNNAGLTLSWARAHDVFLQAR